MILRTALALGLAAVASPTEKCPGDMVRVPGRPACIDRYEAARDGDRAIAKKAAQPATAISHKEATAACARAGKRLCTLEEWTAACKGEGARRKYAYGAKYQPRRCNDRARTGGTGSKPLPSGSLPQCRTPEGVYDLSGNLWEWLADTGPEGATARLIGGGMGNDDDDDNLSCTPEDPLLQPVNQKIEGLGFRCCAELSSSKTP